MKRLTMNAQLMTWLKKSWLVLLCTTLSAEATQLNFGGYNYDTSFGFTDGVRLGTNAVLGAVTTSSGTPTGTTSTAITGTGLSTAGSIAQLTGVSSSFKPLNLPNGNNGVTTRHGVSLFSGTVTNITGPDFVVFESGSTNVPEAFAVRVQDSQSAFSDWYFYAAKVSVSVSNGGVMFVTPFDLSNLGCAEGTVITNVQIINLKPTDRITGTGTMIDGNLVGEGLMDFAGASSVLPYAGTQNTNGFSTFANDQFDPDPIYVAVLLPPPALEFQLATGNAATITAPTWTTATYQLQGSADLKTWTNVGSPVTGDGSVKTFNDTRAADSFFFWRLKMD
jgi:hypothetical protein